MPTAMTTTTMSDLGNLLALADIASTTSSDERPASRSGSALSSVSSPSVHYVSASHNAPAVSSSPKKNLNISRRRPAKKRAVPADFEQIDDSCAIDTASHDTTHDTARRSAQDNADSAIYADPIDHVGTTYEPFNAKETKASSSSESSISAIDKVTSSIIVSNKPKRKAKNNKSSPKSENGKASKMTTLNVSNESIIADSRKFYKSTNSKKNKPRQCSSNRNIISSEPPSFPVILMAILTSPQNEELIAFLSDEQSFIVIDPITLQNDVLPRHFEEDPPNLEQFTACLEKWGFETVNDPNYPNVNVYRHPMFRKGDWEGCLKIQLPVSERGMKRVTCFSAELQENEHSYRQERQQSNHQAMDRRPFPDPFHQYPEHFPEIHYQNPSSPRTRRIEQLEPPPCSPVTMARSVTPTDGNLLSSAALTLGTFCNLEMEPLRRLTAAESQTASSNAVNTATTRQSGFLEAMVSSAMGETVPYNQCLFEECPESKLQEHINQKAALAASLVLSGGGRRASLVLGGRVNNDAIGVGLGVELGCWPCVGVDGKVSGDYSSSSLSMTRSASFLGGVSGGAGGILGKQSHHSLFDERNSMPTRTRLMSLPFASGFNNNPFDFNDGNGSLSLVACTASGMRQKQLPQSGINSQINDRTHTISLTDAEVQSATEGVVSAAINALKRNEILEAKQRNKLSEAKFQQRQQVQQARHRKIKRSRRHTVDNVPRPYVRFGDDRIGGLVGGEICGEVLGGSGNFSSYRPINSSSATSCLDAMTERFLKRSMARLRSRPAGILGPTATQLPTTLFQCPGLSLSDKSGRDNLFAFASGGDCFDGSNSGGNDSSSSRGNNNIMPSKDSFKASLDANADAQIRALFARQES